MRLFGDVVDLRTVTGEPVTVGDVTITPQSQALVIRLPFGAFVWNRPTAVLVEHQGRVERRRIVNVTRVVSIVAIVLGALIVRLSASRRSSEKESEDNGKPD